MIRSLQVRRVPQCVSNRKRRTPGELRFQNVSRERLIKIYQSLQGVLTYGTGVSSMPAQQLLPRTDNTKANMSVGPARAFALLAQVLYSYCLNDNAHRNSDEIYSRC
jgi:hypothetical protein